MLEQLATFCTSPAAWGKVYGGSKREARRPPQDHLGSQHLLANYSTWAFGELATAVICLRCAATSSSASASAPVSAAATGGGGGAAAAGAASASSPDGASSSAAKRQRIGSSSPSVSCPFTAVLAGLQNQAHGEQIHKIYWLQVLSSLLHNQGAGFGQAQAVRFKSVDAAVVPAIVDCLAATMANAGAGSGGLGGGGDPDTVGWVLQCLAGLCDGGQ